MEEMAPYFSLANIELWLVASINLEPALYALEKSLDLIDFRQVKCFSAGRERVSDRGIQYIDIPAFQSVTEYSAFLQKQAAGFVECDHVILVQIGRAHV